MKQILVLSGLIVIALAGCSTVSDLPQGYSLDGKNAEGLAVVSLTLSGKGLDKVSSFEYRIRDAVGDAEDVVNRKPYFHSARQHARWLQDRDAQGPAATRMIMIVKDQALVEPFDVVESGRPIGRLVALRLPPGNYEFYDWKLLAPNQYGGNEFSPNRAMGYRFQIEAGRATYLGNVDLRMTEQDTYKITVENRSVRDLAILANKLPSIKPEEIIYRSMEWRP